MPTKRLGSSHKPLKRQVRRSRREITLKGSQFESAACGFRFGRGSHGVFASMPRRTGGAAQANA